MNIVLREERGTSLVDYYLVFDAPREVLEAAMQHTARTSDHHDLYLALHKEGLATAALVWIDGVYVKPTERGNTLEGHKEIAAIITKVLEWMIAPAGTPLRT